MSRRKTSPAPVTPSTKTPAVTRILSTNGGQNTAELPQLISAPSLAKHWNARPDTLRKWGRDGLLPPPVKIGRSVFFRVDQLAEWLDK